MEFKKENLHASHRKRIKDKYKLHGLDVFEQHEILELALFYVIPRRDTNSIAHSLLEKFGSLHQVLDAPFSVLKEVDGVGEEVACFIKILVDIVRVYMEDKRSNNKNGFKTRDDLNDKLSLKFIGRNAEIVAIMLLDAKRKIVYEGIVNEGSHNSIDIYVRKIIELIVLYNAAGIILAHNHPSGIAVPSRQDIVTTKRLKTLFDNMNVTFIDHIIVADDDYVSLRDSKFGNAFGDD